MFNKFLLTLLLSLVLSSIAYADKYSVRTSSFVPQNGQTVFNGTTLTDCRYKTGWVENGEGAGPGEWIHFFFPTKVVIDSVSVRNGVGIGEDFKKINRLKDVTMSFSGGERQFVTLADSGQEQGLDLLKYPTSSLGLTIRSVYSDGGSDAGIAEFKIRYHKPFSKERNVAAMEKMTKTDVSQKQKSKARKLTAEEKEVLYKKMSKLEKKRFVLKELKVFFDRLYSNFVTINDEYPRMFVEEHFLRESATFESFRAMLEKRGVLDKYRNAVVSTSGLHYHIRTLTPSEVELWVKGEYTVIFDMRANQVPENALYHLKKEYGEWKIKNKLEY